jgi:hypothetical protein
MDDKIFKSLAASILLQAIKDYPEAIENEQNPKYDKDGKRIVDGYCNTKKMNKFFNSKWFEDLCSIVEIAPTHFLGKIEEMKREVGYEA